MSPLLEPHNPAWSTEFSELSAVYEKSLGSLALRIEHVGSTAIPGLAAKPILDIDVVIADYSVFPQVIEALAKLGYSHNGDQGIPQREAFKPADEFAPHVSPPRAWRTHHLYVCPEQSPELARHLRFRDALRANSALREEYERIKRHLAAHAGDDRKIYARLKEEACRDFVSRAVLGEDGECSQAK
ncbi:MAG TPA: GrpB family protein [Candidatus Methylacidiphilales bacterium]|jgi:GrpB-like predicted nucleotidyltransferase (UPF0157 family)|nr:GrpB family protein [Candidatus Methylacidiphilales bacterium]